MRSGRIKRALIVLTLPTTALAAVVSVPDAAQAAYQLQVLGRCLGAGKGTVVDACQEWNIPS